MMMREQGREWYLEAVDPQSPRLTREMLSLREVTLTLTNPNPSPNLNPNPHPNLGAMCERRADHEGEIRSKAEIAVLGGCAL